MLDQSYQQGKKMEQAIGGVTVISRDYDEAFQFYVDALGPDLIRAQTPSCRW